MDTCIRAWAVALCFQLCSFRLRRCQLRMRHASSCLSCQCSQRFVLYCRPTLCRAVCVWPVHRRSCATVHQCRFLTGHLVLWQWLLIARQVLLRYSSVFRCEAVFLHFAFGQLLPMCPAKCLRGGLVCVRVRVVRGWFSPPVCGERSA